MHHDDILSSIAGKTPFKVTTQNAFKPRHMLIITPYVRNSSISRAIGVVEDVLEQEIEPP